MASLSELREIEHERVAAEGAAVRAAELARLAAREAEARAQEVAEAARIREAHEQELAVEAARAAVLREERERLQAAEIAERSRQQAALAETRFAQELELRRAEVAKRRPTWMVVVTGLATLAAGVMIWFAIERQHAAEAAKTQQGVAEAKARAAKADSERAQERVAQLERDLAALEARTDRLIEEIRTTDDAKRREQVNAELVRVRAEQAAIRRQQENERRDRERELRNEPVILDTSCATGVFCGKP